MPHKAVRVRDVKSRSTTSLGFGGRPVVAQKPNKCCPVHIKFITLAKFNHTMEEHLSCLDCPRLFKEPHCLNEHRKQAHGEEKGHTCPYCEKTLEFIFRGPLRENMQKKPP